MDNIFVLCGPGSDRIGSLCVNSMADVFNDAKISLVAPKDSHDLFKLNTDVALIDENEILDKHTFLKSYREQTGTVDRATWYYQQFLKYGIVNSKYNTDDHYVVWDGDTIPLKPIAFVRDGKYQFSRKKEYIMSYFRTLEKLFPGIDYTNANPYGHSFISEYMVFDTEILREMLSKIGENWRERIIGSIHKEDITHSGFSEYETYGTYMTVNYPDRFESVKLNTKRSGHKIFGGRLPTLDELRKANLDLHTITFEWRCIWRDLCRK